MLPSPSLALLRRSILAAAGLGVAACTTSPSKTGHGGAGGTAAHTSSSSGSTSTTASSSGHGGAGGGTTSSGHGGTAGMGGMNGGGGMDPVCAGATVILTNDKTPSGFAECPDGTVHRVEAVTCDPTISAPSCMGTEMTLSCTSDAECTAGAYGKCASFTTVADSGGLLTSCSCAYSCTTDADCNTGDAGAGDAGTGGAGGAGAITGSACVCGGVVPMDNNWSFCAPAACATGAACPSGECGLSEYFNGCLWDVELQCRSATDACRSEADCATDGGGLHKTCVFPMDTAWQCKGWTCILGRPLIVEGAPRTAPSTARDDWSSSAPAGLDLAGLDEPSRAALARHWLEVAAAEHASVASFARFTLELCAMGAPASLVADAQRAGLDEIEHARIAYGMASACAGRALGPGPLAMGPLRIAGGRMEMLRSLIEEACVGETLGVAEALAFAEAARDPALAQIHRRIAADEQRHAELAWRTLAWLLDGADDAMRHAAGLWFEGAMAAAGRDTGGDAARAPGLPGERELSAVRRQTIRDVIAPCADAVLGRQRPGGLTTEARRTRRNP
jgi:hypothetical protein